MKFTTRSKSSSVIWVSLQPPSPYAFYYRYALCPLLLASFRIRAAYASVSLRGVGSTSRRPDGARFNVFFLQRQANRFPIHTELFRRDQNNREPAVLFPKGCFGHKFDAGKIVERLPNKRRLTKEYQGVDWELNRKGSDFSFILKYP